MEKNNTHSDLAQEMVKNKQSGLHYQRFIQHFDDIQVESYDILKDFDTMHKGHYHEIYFHDISLKLIPVIQHYLYEMLKDYDYPRLLIVGLGNQYLTSDAIGPRCLRDLHVTHYLDDSVKLNQNFFDILAFTPGVMFQTGMESFDLISSIVLQEDIDIVIAIDALCASDYQKLSHVIQINDVGIHPGSGIGNHRKAINQESLGVPVIAIGVPTVIYASSLLKDSLSLIKDYFGDAILQDNRLKVGKRTYKGTLSYEQVKQLLGEVGLLNDEDLQDLLLEVLTPVDGNYVMSDKQVDEHVEKISTIICESINGLRHNIHG